MVIITSMNNNGIHVRAVRWDDAKTSIRNIREKVFIIEQKVPADLEWDGEDENAMHVLAGMNDTDVATGRLLHSGQIGRMAVLSAYRRRGIGSAILSALLELARENRITSIFLNAQLHARDFYAGHGFVQEGEVFDDAGIVHCRMKYRQE